jgi:hypothetical protein
VRYIRRLPSMRRLAAGAGSLLALATIAGGLAQPATARAEGAPWWHLSVGTRPSVLSKGGEGTIDVAATNIGDAPTDEPITLTETLPAGMTVREKAGVPEVGFFAFFSSRGLTNFASHCTVSGARVTCTLPDEPPTFPVQHPFETIEMRIGVTAGSESGDSEAEVSGGGARSQSLKRPESISGTAPGFGTETYEITPENEGGTIDTQAGSHPFQLTTTFALNQTANPLAPPALPRNLEFNLPPGLIGNATKFPLCSELDFKKTVNFQNLCPGDTVVGVATVTFDEPKEGFRTWPFPIFNLVPEKGEPARFGFPVLKSPIVMDTSVRSGSDYGVTVTASNISQVVNLLSASVTFWGAPSAPSHNEARGFECLANHADEELGERCPESNSHEVAPFLTLPTSCTLPFSTTVSGVSWPRRASPEGEEAAESVPLPESSYTLQDAFGRELSLTGCNQVPFEPSIVVSPEAASASTPTGLKVAVRVPQETDENASGIASSAIRNLEVTLPEGLIVNAASAGGLEACSEAQVGFEEVQPATGTDLFTPGLAEPFCPEASKVGLVKIKVPVLAHPLEGALYLAAQNANPFGSLLASYIVAEDPISGVRVKLAGEVSPDAASGQLVTSFRNTPQAPLEEAEIRLFGGQRAPLATSPQCGAYTTDATFAPWSGTAEVSSSSSFEVQQGPHGGPCPSPAPFAPSLQSGSSNPNAGVFSPLNTVIAREDGQQAIQAIQLHFPSGLAGIIAGVKLCPEAQANAGTCGPESLIAQTTASVGVGDEPFTVTGGQAFLTESYEGAPYGLSIVTPAVAGPFNLGDVVVRAKLEIDPHTAALTATSEAIPHILDGIPLELKQIDIEVNRPNFTFNPTNCEPLEITGTVTSVEGASAPLSTPFQVTNCSLLKFTPTIAVSAGGHGSKVDGTGLVFKLSYPKGALGSQAWFDEAKFDIPKQLPSRLGTIQQACTSQVFESDRAKCPPASLIGHAVVHTPVLPVPLEGPLYFVSFGNLKFPDAVMVLKGYGVTVELDGETFVDHKTGVTSATFRNTPDVPFESLEVTVPRGPFSEFGVNLPKDDFDLCGHSVSMPTFFKAQNGLEIRQSTHVAITGCAAPRHKKKKGKASARHRGHG